MWFPLQILSVFFWACLNVLNSILVKHYENRPYVLQWFQGLFTLAFLAIVILTHPELRTGWATILVVSGMCAYFGDALFFFMLDSVDVSVLNIAWALLAIFLSIGGFVLFGETWSVLQWIGVVLVLCGITLLSSWHRKIADPKSLLLFPVLAAIHTPFFLSQKAAIFAGESVLTAFTWSLLGREVLAWSVPFLFEKRRAVIFEAVRTKPLTFHIINGGVVSLFLIAVFLTATAYTTGPVSLVSVIGNVQPFFVLFLAWLVWKTVPRFASRELLTRQAVSVKIISFLIVFGGLALLALPQ